MADPSSHIFVDLPAWKVAEAQTTAVFLGWSPIIALQLQNSLLERTVEGELIPMTREMGIAVMPWSPLKAGFLSGSTAVTMPGRLTLRAPALRWTQRS